LFVGCIGGGLIFTALPTPPLDISTWWQHTDHVLFLAGVVAIVFAIFVPKGWCDAVVWRFPRSK